MAGGKSGISLKAYQIALMAAIVVFLLFAFRFFPRLSQAPGNDKCCAVSGRHGKPDCFFPFGSFAAKSRR